MSAPGRIAGARPMVRDELARDDQSGSRARRQPGTALGWQAEITDLDHQLVGQRIGDLAADLLFLGRAWRQLVGTQRLVDRATRPGSSCTSPGQTEKFCTTTTCGRGSIAAVSTWLELCVHPVSSAAHRTPRRPRQSRSAPHPLPSHCAPAPDTRLSWPPRPFSKMKDRVLMPDTGCWQPSAPVGETWAPAWVPLRRGPYSPAWLAVCIFFTCSMTWVRL